MTNKKNRVLQTHQPHSPFGRVGPGLRVQWNAGSLRTCAAFFSPDDGRRVLPRGSVPSSQCQRWDRHRRLRYGVRGVVPGRGASQPTYGSALLTHSARKIGRLPNRLRLKIHLRASFPGLCVASRFSSAAKSCSKRRENSARGKRRRQASRFILWRNCGQCGKRRARRMPLTPTLSPQAGRGSPISPLPSGERNG